MCPMGKTVQVAADRAYDQSRTVLPAEVARGTYMQAPPGLAAPKLMHVLLAKAGGRRGEDVEPGVRLSEVRGVEGLRNHDRASLAPLFAELQAAVLIHDDTEKKRLTIGGLLDIAEVDYRDELSGDLVISWYFSRMFTRAAAASNHWAILDRDASPGQQVLPAAVPAHRQPCQAGSGCQQDLHRGRVAVRSRGRAGQAGTVLAFQQPGDPARDCRDQSAFPADPDRHSSQGRPHRRWTPGAP